MPIPDGNLEPIKSKIYLIYALIAAVAVYIVYFSGNLFLQGGIAMVFVFWAASLVLYTVYEKFGAIQGMASSVAVVALGYYYYIWYGKLK